MAKNVIIRQARDSFGVLLMAQAIENTGGDVFSIASNGQEQQFGALIPSTRYIVCAKFEPPITYDELDEAMDKAIDEARHPIALWAIPEGAKAMTSPLRNLCRISCEKLGVAQSKTCTCTLCKAADEIAEAERTKRRNAELKKQLSATRKSEQTYKQQAAAYFARMTELTKQFEHTFTPDNIGDPEPSSDVCKSCGLNIRNPIHTRTDGK